MVKDALLVHCIGYDSIPEGHYIPDNSVGVRIGSNAITAAMSRCASQRVGQLHVHSHGGRGLPSPSPDDYREVPSLARSLRHVNVKQAQGWAILSSDNALTFINLPGDQDDAPHMPVSIIGYPTTIPEGPARKRGFVRSIFNRATTRRSNRYARQNFLGMHSDSILAHANIGIIGLGGGGSHVAQQLAHLGVANFVLCDKDRITETNLNRTVNATALDVLFRRYKADIAARGIRRLLSNAEIVNHRDRWETAGESLMRCDIIIGCVDSFAARRDLEAFCRRHLIPYVDVGMDVQKVQGGHEIIGQVILSMPARPCMRCMGFLNDKVLADEAADYGAAGARPQVVWSNGVLCSAAVGIVVDLLTGWSKSGRDCIYLNFRGCDLSLTDDPRLEYIEDNDCPHYPTNASGRSDF
jgi:ThiF family protein